MKHILLLSFFFCLNSVLSQEEIFIEPYEEAIFLGKGGLKAFIDSNIRIPKSLDTTIINPKVHLRFCVEIDGSLSEIKVAKGIPSCPECDAEAIRLISIMPKWKPGKESGKIVRMPCLIPISFKKR